MGGQDGTNPRCCCVVTSGVLVPAGPLGRCCGKTGKGEMPQRMTFGPIGCGGLTWAYNISRGGWLGNVCRPLAVRKHAGNLSPTPPLRFPQNGASFHLFSTCFPQVFRKISTGALTSCASHFPPRLLARTANCIAGLGQMWYNVFVKPRRKLSGRRRHEEPTGGSIRGGTPQVLCRSIFGSYDP